jgi:hypothetical protein
MLTKCDRLIEERVTLSRELGVAAHSLQALLMPGKATKHLVEYLNKIGKEKR